MAISNPMKRLHLQAGGPLAFLLWVLASAAHAQDLEPRRWSHMPVGTDYAGLGYAYSEGNIAFAVSVLW
jgi:hypothetical protein